MWRVNNTGKRAFISKATSILKGGEKINGTEDAAINPGHTADVTDELGEFLSTYSDIKVINRPSQTKKKGDNNVLGSASSK